MAALNFSRFELRVSACKYLVYVSYPFFSTRRFCYTAVKSCEPAYRFWRFCFQRQRSLLSRPPPNLHPRAIRSPDRVNPLVRLLREPLDLLDIAPSFRVPNITLLRMTQCPVVV